MAKYIEIIGGRQGVNKIIDSQYHGDFSISSIISCLIYLPCINNKDDDDDDDDDDDGDDDDGLGISS